MIVFKQETLLQRLKNLLKNLRGNMMGSSKIDDLEREEGWVEIIDSMLMEEVPSSFPDSEGKVWIDYVGNLYHNSINDGKVLIPIGSRDEYGNRHLPVGRDELNIWIDYFGLEIMKTKSEGKKLIRVEESDGM